jgi:hypothetical protein
MRGSESGLGRMLAVLFLGLCLCPPGGGETMEIYHDSPLLII